MPRSRKQHRTDKPAVPAADVGLETWRQRIETLLARGKSRDAVEAAKQCLKHFREPAAEALAVKAYTARIEALQANGMHHEAQALCALVNERFPAYQGQMALLQRQSEVSAGNFDGLLTELATADAARRRELEAILAQGLTDPAMLAQSAALPGEHPLKRLARTVSELFTAVTSGPLPAGALAALDAIPRNSLLAPWKLLIRALEAFYRGADAAVLANLSAMPLDSVPGRLVPVLRQLVGGNPLSAERSFAVTTLLEQVSGRQHGLRTQILQLSQALAARHERQALVAVQALLQRLRSAPAALRRTFLASILHHWHRQDLPPKNLLRLLPHGKNEPDILRLVALTLERAGWDSALDMWDTYLDTATAAGILSTTGPEIARVLLHMANLFPQDLDTVLDTLEVDSVEQLQYEVRIGELPSCFDRAALLDRARAADPVPLVFRALVSHYEQWGDAKRAEAAALAWRRMHPQDVEPLLYLIRATEKRGSVRKALNFLAEAEALDRVHPQVRQSRFRLLLAGAERRLKEHKPALALDDLQQLELEPRASEGDHQTYLLVLRWAALQQLGDSAEAERLQHTLTTAGNPILSGLIREALNASLKVNLPPLPAASASPAQTLDGLARACELFRALDRPLAVPEALLKRVEQHLASASAAQLHALCAGGLWIGKARLTYRAAGYGLELQDPLAYRFLLARGQALSTGLTADAEHRARQCLRAARALAGRVHDMETVREAAAALKAMPDWDLLHTILAGVPAHTEETPPSQEEIGHIMASERKNGTVPQFRSTATARRSRQAKAPRRRMPYRLFDDLLPFFAPEEDY